MSPTAPRSPAKVFVCSGFGDCHMKFTRSEHLARHIRKHTGERPFACHCGRRFSRLDNLRQHAQTVHADQPDLNADMISRLAALHADLSSSTSSISSMNSAIPPQQQPPLPLAPPVPVNHLARPSSHPYPPHKPAWNNPPSFSSSHNARRAAAPPPIRTSRPSSLVLPPIRSLISDPPASRSRPPLRDPFSPAIATAPLPDHCHPYFYPPLSSPYSSSKRPLTAPSPTRDSSDLAPYSPLSAHPVAYYHNYPRPYHPYHPYPLRSSSSSPIPPHSPSSPFLHLTSLPPAEAPKARPPQDLPHLPTPTSANISPLQSPTRISDERSTARHDYPSCSSYSSYPTNYQSEYPAVKKPRLSLEHLFSASQLLEKEAEAQLLQKQELEQDQQKCSSSNRTRADSTNSACSDVSLAGRSSVSGDDRTAASGDISAASSSDDLVRPNRSATCSPPTHRPLSIPPQQRFRRSMSPANFPLVQKEMCSTVR